MTTLRNRLIAGLLALMTIGAGAGSMTKYKVTAKVDKRTDFSRLRTYAWDTGLPAFRDSAHERILLAVDRELARRGFSVVPEDKADVIVKYSSFPRTDVNFKSKTRLAHGERATFPVVALVVTIRNPRTRLELFSARAITPVRLETDLDAIVDRQIDAIFEKYPVDPGRPLAGQ